MSPKNPAKTSAPKAVTDPAAAKPTAAPSAKPSKPAAQNPAATNAMPAGFRVEKDSMGEVRGPGDRVYGAQTQRAVDNFKVSGRPMPARFIAALAHGKWASAQANEALRLLDARLASAIRAAADDVVAGKHAAEF